MSTDNCTELPTHAERSRIYPLVSDAANRRLLVQWVRDHDQYELVDPDTPFSSAQFDLCLLDVAAATEHREELRDRKDAAAPVSLPYLVLLPGDRRAEFDAEHRALTDSELVDDVAFLPIRKAELAWRVRSLLRLRTQSRRLNRYNRLHEVYRTINRCLVDVEDRCALLDAVVETLSEYAPFGRVVIVLVGEDSTEMDCGVGTGMTDEEVREYHLPDRAEATVDGGPFVDVDQTAQTEVTVPLEYDGRAEGTLTVQYRPETVSIQEELDLLEELAEDVAFAVHNLRLQVDHEAVIAKLTERNRQLEVIDRVLRHNFHNKINVIKGYAKMAAREAEDGVAAYVETIDDAVDRLVELVDKEHEITQILSDPPAVEAFDVVPVVESAAATVAAKYPEATIETDLPETCSVVASVEIGQAIAELIENGVVYSEPTDPTVVVAVATEGEMARVSVSDEGKSIPEIEQRVHTGDADITQLSHGLGLGLRLVSLLAEQSGGELEFETNEPKGSTVTLEFATPSETAEEDCR